MFCRKRGKIYAYPPYRRHPRSQRLRPLRPDHRHSGTVRHGRPVLSAAYRPAVHPYRRLSGKHLPGSDGPDGPHSRPLEGGGCGFRRDLHRIHELRGADGTDGGVYPELPAAGMSCPHRPGDGGSWPPLPDVYAGDVPGHGGAGGGGGRAYPQPHRSRAAAERGL